MSLARGEVVLLSLPPLELEAREVCGAEGDLDLGRVAEQEEEEEEERPARLPLGLSHCLAY